MKLATIFVKRQKFRKTAKFIKKVNDFSQIHTLFSAKIFKKKFSANPDIVKMDGKKPKLLGKYR